ncbi:MAG: threonine/serine dehydratase [Candidatus Promineifilaceae bacterium]
MILTEVLKAAKVIRPYIHQIPMRRCRFLGEQTGATVWLKLENWQPTGSFKIRGATNRLSQLSEEEKARGVVVASAGNHGLGVAYAVENLGGTTADIFLPQTAPSAKVEKLRRFKNVELHLVGETYADAVAAADDFAEQGGGVKIQAYDDPVVIAGQGTIGLEILQERPETEIIVVPVGGGGLIAGISAAVRSLNPDCSVVGVQAAASPAALLSLRDNVSYDPYDHEPTIADGLAGGFGEWPLRIGREFIDRILLASEAEMRQAIYALLEQEQLVVEASGAAAIVPLLNGSLDVKDKNIVCVLSGGNLAIDLLKEIAKR